MNAAFRKRGVYQLYVPGTAGYRQRSTGTRDATVARKMRRMVETLRDAHEYDLLDRVIAGSLTLRELYVEYAANRLELLRARLADLDLAEHLDAWERWVRSDRGATQTAERYRQQVESLVASPFRRSELTPARVMAWLAQLGGSSGTRRKYLYALHSFVGYLVTSGVLTRNPIAEVKAPKKNPPRLRWETVDTDERIVVAAPAEYRALFAFIHATGAEVSAALATLRRDVDLEQALAHIRGTKTESRNRHDALIEPWALPYLREHCRTVTPNAHLWPGISRYQAAAHHQATCAAVGVEDYHLRCARHSWAVRARKRGVSLEAIAAQLGHSSILMAATVYGRFTPTLDERRAERREAR